MSVCCPRLGDICEPVALAPCPAELETRVSDATLLEVRGGMSRAPCWVSCEFDIAVLEGNALVSGGAVEPGCEELTPFPDCSAVDDWVVCGTTSFVLS